MTHEPTDTPVPNGSSWLTLEEIARVCHEANRAMQSIQVGHGDTSVAVAPTWEECGDEMRRSAAHGVLGVLQGDTPEELHERWLQFKVDHGWVYGPVKDEQAKQHPCIVQYHDLPLGQQLKDHLFSSIVRALAAPGSGPDHSDGS